MIDSGVCTSCKTTYKWSPGRGKMAAACRGSTVDRHLEETILWLPSHLTEMERHRVTANVAMCELFIRRTEDYARLLRVFIASFAESGTAIPEMLMQEVQELLANVESYAQHFEGRILVLGQRSEALQASTPETNRNSRQGRPKFELSFGEIWSLWSAGFKWSKIP